MPKRQAITRLLGTDRLNRPCAAGAPATSVDRCCGAQVHRSRRDRERGLHSRWQAGFSYRWGSTVLTSGSPATVCASNCGTAPRSRSGGAAHCSRRVEGCRRERRCLVRCLWRGAQRPTMTPIEAIGSAMTAMWNCLMCHLWTVTPQLAGMLDGIRRGNGARPALGWRLRASIRPSLNTLSSFVLRGTVVLLTLLAARFARSSGG